MYPDLTDAVMRIFELREKLIPYFKRVMDKCVQDHRPMVYPVFVRYPGFDTESDSFMCGDDLLVCPVFEEGAEKVAVRLPEESGGWLLRGHGEPLYGPVITAECRPDDEPVWFRRYSLSGK